MSGNTVKSIDFAAEDPAELETWIAALEVVITRLERSQVTFDERLWLMKHFKKADVDKNGKIFPSVMEKLIIA